MESVGEACDGDGFSNEMSLPDPYSLSGWPGVREMQHGSSLAKGTPQQHVEDNVNVDENRGTGNAVRNTHFAPNTAELPE